MIKRQHNFRLGGETRAALERLQAVHGYENATDALEDAVQRAARSLDRAGAAAADKFSVEEWCLMADVTNGTMWPAGRPNGQWLALEISDGHALNGAGYRWLAGEGETALANERVRALAERLAELPDDEAHAVARAVCWFWVHASDGRVTLESPWWRPTWRESLAEKGGK